MEEEHEEEFEATRDYSKMKMFTGKSPNALEDVNTKIYIGSEVNDFKRGQSLQCHITSDISSRDCY